MQSSTEESSEILIQAKAGSDAPHGWVVLPLVRRNVLLSIVGWIFGLIIGFGLLAAIALIVIPYNYEHGIAPAILSTLLLGLLLFIALGSCWSLFIDIRRLRNLDKHLIVITPDAFVKQEGEKIIHVPLMYVRHVTARGAPPPQDTSAEVRAQGQSPSAGENILGFFVGRGFSSSGLRARRTRMRTPTSLAFIDSRTDNEVTVVTDNSYGDPFAIAALLKQYAKSAQNIT